MKIYTGNASKEAARDREHMLVIEAGPHGRWVASRVNPKPGIVVQRELVDAATLKDPGVRCIQRLASRLLGDVGPASGILFLLERLAPRNQLTPSMLSSYPVPVLAASPTIGLAHAVPPHLRRFALLDFGGQGKIALVKRSADGRICDYSPVDADLQTQLGIDRAPESASGDLLVDVLGAQSTAGRDICMMALVRAVAPLLDSASAFGFEAVVCASRLFLDPLHAAAFLRIMKEGRGRRGHAELLCGQDERAIAGARLFSGAATGPGTWISGPAASRRLSVMAPRNVEYHITHVDNPVFDPKEPALARMLDDRPVLFVIDKIVERTYGDALRAYAAQHLSCVDICRIDATEASKTWPQVEEICTRAIHSGLRRDGVIVAVGGGITLDITGVAASMYRRGVRYARIPTTLVGMVDVCVGIKQGINMGSKKNILGAFYPPFGGINDLSFLKTAPKRQLACGIGEIIKMAIVRDPFLFELLEAHTRRLLQSHFQAPRRAAEQIVIRAELAMMSELQPNLYEEDLRRLVDFGHSFSPALESASRYELHHGEAVGIDMMVCTSIAVRRGMCDESAMRRIANVYAVAGLPLIHELCQPEFMCDSLKDVRIHRGGNLNLVVPTGIGSATFVQDVTPGELAVALRDIASFAHDVAPMEEPACAYASG